MSPKLLGLGRPRQNEADRYSAARDRAAEWIRQAEEIDGFAAELVAEQVTVTAGRDVIAATAPLVEGSAPRPTAEEEAVARARGAAAESEVLIGGGGGKTADLSTLPTVRELEPSTSSLPRGSQPAGTTKNPTYSVRRGHLIKGSTIMPLEDHILVQPLEAERTTKLGLVIPDTAKDKPQEGKVLATGPGRIDGNGNRVPLDVSVDDVVIFSKYGGTEVKYKGQDELLLSARDILAILPQKDPD